MATEFVLNTLEFGDAAGWGTWLVGHFRQHLRYNAVLAARTPSVQIATFNILQMGMSALEKRFWLDAHQSWHALLRPFANVTGIDLAGVDIDDRNQFYGWIDLHNQEHRVLDQAFGVG